MAIIVVPLLVVSAADVAVMVIVCCELVAAGAVKVAEDVVEPDRVPALAFQVTPADFRSLATVALRVMESVPSTLFALAATETAPTAATAGEPPPPQPVKVTRKTKKTKVEAIDSEETLRSNIDPSRAPSKRNGYFDLRVELLADDPLTDLRRAAGRLLKRDTADVRQ
jgi:hypothetical protein